MQLYKGLTIEKYPTLIINEKISLITQINSEWILEHFNWQWVQIGIIKLLISTRILNCINLKN